MSVLFTNVYLIFFLSSHLGDFTLDPEKRDANGMLNGSDSMNHRIVLLTKSLPLVMVQSTVSVLETSQYFLRPIH